MNSKKYQTKCDNCGAVASELLDVEDAIPKDWFEVTPFSVTRKLYRKTSENSHTDSVSKRMNWKTHYCSQSCVDKQFKDFFTLN